MVIIVLIIFALIFRKDAVFPCLLCPWDSQFQNIKSNTVTYRRQKFRRDSLFTKSMCPWDSQFQNLKLNTDNLIWQSHTFWTFHTFWTGCLPVLGPVTVYAYSVCKHTHLPLFDYSRKYGFVLKFCPDQIYAKIQLVLFRPQYHSGWTPFYFMYDPKCSTTFPWCTINAPTAFAWCTINVPAAFARCTNRFVHKVEFSYIGWNGVHPLWVC